MRKISKNRIIKISNLLLAEMIMLITILLPYYQVNAEEYWPSSVDVNSTSAIVIEQETGAILYSQNDKEKLYPASITKVMTALIALENSDLDETVVFSADAVYKNEGGTSSIARDLNEEMSMEYCLYGMMLESANECAWAIAEHIAGDVDSFSDMMNEKAAELGCVNTHFSNPNGLHKDDHYTCAYDMALISREAFKNKKFQQIVGTKSYTIPPTNKHKDETPLNNHHKMLHFYHTSKYLYEYCLGGKTGYTDNAGNTLVSYARKDGMTLVCVVMNASEENHYVDTTNLFNYCFDNFNVYNVSKNTKIEDVESQAGSFSDNKGIIGIDPAGVVVLPKTATYTDAKMSVESCKDSDKNVVAQIAYTYANRYVGGAKIYFSTDEPNYYPFDTLDVAVGGSGKDFYRIDFKYILLILLVIVAIACLIYYIYSKSGDILLFKHRHIDSKRKPKTNFKKINRKRKRRKKALNQRQIYINNKKRRL